MSNLSTPEEIEEAILSHFRAGDIEMARRAYTYAAGFCCEADSPDAAGITFSAFGAEWIVVGTFPLPCCGKLVGLVSRNEGVRLNRWVGVTCPNECQPGVSHTVECE